MVSKVNDQLQQEGKSAVTQSKSKTLIVVLIIMYLTVVIL